MRKSPAILVLVLAAPLAVAGVAQASTGCQVWSGGGWLAGPCAAPTDIPVQRLAGKTRYDTAAAISAAHFQPGVEVVYLANGENTVDALAIGPVADGPVLLVPRSGSLPAGTAAELARLDPGSITVLGSSAAVSEDMVAQAIAAAR